MYTIDSKKYKENKHDTYILINHINSFFIFHALCWEKS
jgi:hypothetical protein